MCLTEKLGFIKLGSTSYPHPTKWLKYCLVFQPSPSEVFARDVCFCYRVRLQYKTIVFVWEIVFIQPKIEIHNHINSSWHKIIKKMTVHVGEVGGVKIYYHMWFLVWDGSKVFTPKSHEKWYETWLVIKNILISRQKSQEKSCKKLFLCEPWIIKRLGFGRGWGMIFHQILVRMRIFKY